MRPFLIAIAFASALPFAGWAAQGRAASGATQSIEQGGMAQMADAMKRMAEMCETMMKKEMAGQPAKMAAAIVLGLLLIVNLSLLAILEVQWIRHWSRKLRAERQT